MTYQALIWGIVLASAAGAQGSSTLVTGSGSDSDWGRKPGWSCRVAEEKNGRIFARVNSLPGDGESYQLKIVSVDGRVINPIAAVNSAQRVDVREPLFILRGEADDRDHSAVELTIDQQSGGFENLPAVLDINQTSIDMRCSRARFLIEPVATQTGLQ